MTPRIRQACCLVVVAVVGACGPRTPSASDGSLERLAWMRGDWQATDGRGSEHWFDPGGTVYGVALRDDGFEAMMIDEDPPLVSGPLVFFAMPEGRAAVRFPLTQQADTAVRFENPAHDDPTSVAYALDAGSLVATLATRGAAGSAVQLAAGQGAAAPELEAADRAFLADTQARGAEGWASHYAADGAMGLSGEEHVQGPAAIQAHMAELFGAAALSWAPTLSRRRDRYGFTAGTFTLEGKSYRESGTYVTIWRRDDDTTWRIVFDVGRTQSRTTK